MNIADMQHAVIESIGHQEALDPPSESLQQALDGAFASGGPVGKAVEDALHGTWLGHALHPVLTDIPIGAWTVTQVLDILEEVSGNDEYAPGADMALTIGLVGALGSAVTGLADWNYTSGDSRRIGAVHGLLNVGATALYGLSLRARKRGDRQQGRVLAAAGYSAVMVSAMLGGDLVYRLGVGVNRAPKEDEIDELELDDFKPMLAADKLEEGQIVRVETNDTPIALIKQHGQIYAMAELCSHLSGPLSEGKLNDGCIECPWHGSQFALADGKVLKGPATIPQVTFLTRERNGMIEVKRQ